MDGVCSFWEAAQSLVASLAERMGLLAHTPDAVEAAREKQVQTTAPLSAQNQPCGVYLALREQSLGFSRAGEVFSFEQNDAHSSTLLRRMLRPLIFKRH